MNGSEVGGDNLAAPSGPTPTDAAGFRPAPLTLIHRTRAADAFPVGWRRAGEDRYAVRAYWPHDHPYFAPVHGDRHDPLLVVETFRQAALLIVHGEYGVPVDHQFLLSDLEFACDPEHLAVGGRPTEVDVDVSFSEMRQRSGGLAQLRVDWALFRSGVGAGTGTGHARMISPALYRRLRGERLAPVSTVSALPPAPPYSVGRTSAADVLLSPTLPDDPPPLPNSLQAPYQVWQLRVDTGHPTLFQHPNDHVPGMLLFEAARQAALLATGSAEFSPTHGRITFRQYAELDEPCLIHAATVPADEPGAVSVRTTGHQNGEPVFEAVLTSSPSTT
jgi:hypothetical protein